MLTPLATVVSAVFASLCIVTVHTKIIFGIYRQLIRRSVTVAKPNGCDEPPVIQKLILFDDATYDIWY